MTIGDSNTRSTVQGLQSDALLAAFQAAIGGKPDVLELLLCRAAGWPGGKMNFKLAAAFGVQVGESKGNVLPLLERFSDDDAPTNTPRVFLPVAAVYGWAALLRAEREQEAAWLRVCELGSDGRQPIRLAAIEALTALSTQKGGADRLLSRGELWFDIDDRDLRFGAAALVLDVFGSDQVMSVLRDHEGLRTYLSRVIDEIGDAPRAAERSETRRRALLSLPRALTVAAGRMPGDSAEAWLIEECTKAKHPRVREALSNTIVMMRKTAQKPLADTLSKILEGSAAPRRDPTQQRKGTGRGKSTRRIR